MDDVFKKFLDLYSRNNLLLYHISDLESKSNGGFMNKSGESTSLALKIHEEFQFSCRQIVNLNHEGWPMGIVISKRNELIDNLKNSVSFHIEENSVISPDAGFTQDDVSNNMVKAIFDPLIDAADEVDIAIHSNDPDYQNIKAFRKENEKYKMQ